MRCLRGAYSTIRYRLAGPTGPTGACHGCRDRAMNLLDASDSRACTRVIAFRGKGGNHILSNGGLENLGGRVDGNKTIFEQDKEADK